MRIFLFWLALLAAVTFVSVVRAQAEPSTAQQWFERGVELTKAEQWSEAQASFERSIELEPRAATYLNLAIVRYRQGDYVSALGALEIFERDAGQQEDVRKRAQWLRDNLAQHVVRFQLHVEPAAAIVQIDGKDQAGQGQDRSLWLAAGQHEVSARADGYQEDRMRIVATAGAEAQASISLKREQVVIPPVTLSDDARGGEPSQRGAPPAPVDDARRPLWKNPWLWTAVGVVVLAGATTATVLLLREPEKEGCVEMDGVICIN